MRISPLFLFATSASAFSTARFGAIRPHTFLQSAKVDTSEAIAAALEASKKYGAASPEAMVAWDTVEELSAADNSAAYEGGVSDEECLQDEAMVKSDCEEYEQKLASLAALLEENKAKIEQVKSLASEIQAIKLVQPESKAGSDSDALKVALADAKEAVEKHGKESQEARLAWETVEEIAAAGTSDATQANLYDECLVEALEACEALDELARVMYLEKNKTGRYSG